MASLKALQQGLENESGDTLDSELEPAERESTATSVSAKLKRMVHRSPLPADGIVHRAAAPSRDQPLFDKLKAMGSTKPDKAVDNILDGAPTLKPIIMSGIFDGMPGYATIIGQLQVPNMCRDNAPVLAKAKELKTAGFKLEFEKTKNTQAISRRSCGDKKPGGEKSKK